MPARYTRAAMSTGRRVWRDRIVVVLLMAAILLAGLLPLAGQRRLGGVVGWLAWKADRQTARVTRRNLALCFPTLDPDEREALGRRSLQQTAMLAGEAGALYRWSTARCRQLAIRVTGLEALQKALASGRGVLLLVPHLGNWEYLSLFLGPLGVVALYDPPRIRALERPILAARSRTGATLLPIDRRGLRAVYAALAGGGLVALLPDQVPDRAGGLHAPFFGQPALTMTLAHRLIQRTAPVVFFGVALRAQGGFDVRFEAAEPALHATDPLTSLAAMNRAIEALVQAAPEQYQWEYKRFKRPPAGRPDPYRS